jgi:PAS domain-containing protein
VRVVVEVAVAAPAADVWRALRDPSEIRRWHGWQYDQLDDEIDAIFLSDVTESEADGVLDTHGGGRFELETRGGETVVRVTRSPAEGYGGPESDWDAIDEGWVTFVQQLRFMLERHRGDERRTLHFDGNRRAADAPRPADVLGIAHLDAGGPYSIDAPFGQRLEGDVWFRSAHQIGLTVNGWGDGLIVVADRPADEDRPHGGAKVVATTYAVDDEDLAELERRLGGWWRALYPQRVVSGS